MKIYLKKAIFINRAPFDKLELDLYKNEISVLTAVNGKGKTTILSHIVDAFHEMARPNFSHEYEGKENKLYRLSSPIHNLKRNDPSFVYLRFIAKDEVIDYVDIRNNCTEDEYNQAITIEGKIPFNQIQNSLKVENYVKEISSNFNKEKAENIFRNNLITYFPAYRYEQPGYLNDPYKIKLNFRKESGFSGQLINPIEVISGLPQLADWIMDVVLDLRSEDVNGITNPLFNNINSIITKSLMSKKYGSLRFGVGPRRFGGTRIQIVKQLSGELVYPTIFNLSSGEASLFSLFTEILRQADGNKENIILSEITGIVLIDEVDKHLHIKLQKEVLPELFKLFPNIQFILSSHSPFLSMGLAECLQARSKILDLDNLGVSVDPTTNELYKEVYDMMVGENQKFKEMYELLEKEIKKGSSPLIITEGKTDVQHIDKAKEKLDIDDLDIDFHQITGNWGDSKLKLLLKQLSKVPQSRKIIGIFDRDVENIIKEIEKDYQSFMDYGNNVYAFCIPVPESRKSYKNISIELYYSDSELKTKNSGKCLYFNNEVEIRQSASDKQNRRLIKLENPKIDDENTKKIYDENIGELDWIHSKSRFADLVEGDEDFISKFSFDNFKMIFEKIKEIISKT